MSRISSFLLAATSSLIVLIGTSCGGGSRQLQSIAVTPPNADARTFSGGMVQFSAVGTYSGGSPSHGPVTPIQWCASSTAGVCNAGVNTPDVTINQNGMAQCAAGAAGTWIINANSPPVQGQPGGYVGPTIVFGSAT